MERLGKVMEQIHWETMLFSSLRIVLILLIGWFVLSAVRVALRRMESLLIERARGEGELAGEAAKRAETLAKLIRQAAVILIWVLMGLMILREIGIEIAPILASAGIVGLAVGFGAQNLVRDLITGFFMILENQVRVGDAVVVNGTKGVAEKINLRTIVLRDGAGVVHVFPNGLITTLANETREWSAYVFTISVAYREDTDRVIEIMRQTGRELRQEAEFGAQMLNEVEIFGIDQLADAVVSIKGRIKTLPGAQDRVGREYLNRLKKAFGRAGIEMPVPRPIDFGAADAPLTVRLLDGANDPGRSAAAAGKRDA
jgi:small conductance mechanosensitive channel